MVPVVRVARRMSDWSRMGVVIRPEVHARFAAVLARVPGAVSATSSPRRGLARFPTKLSPARVERLRQLRAGGLKLDALARLFGISLSTASRAASGRTW